MSALKQRAQTLIEAARVGDDPKDADCERLLRSLHRSLGIAAGVSAVALTGAERAAEAATGKVASVSAASAGHGAGVGAAGSATGFKVFGGALAKYVVVGCLVGGVGAIAVVATAVRPPTPATSPVVAQVPSPTALASADEVPPGPLPERTTDEVQPGPLPERTTDRVENADLPPPASSEADAHPGQRTRAPLLDQEIALLRRARSLMSAGNAAGALRLLERHEREFPRAVLAEDRDALRVFALRTLGDADSARSFGQRFLRDHPRSPHAGAVRESCGASCGTTPGGTKH